MRVSLILLVAYLACLTACHFQPTTSQPIQLFSGQSSTYETQLWQTDQTAAGTTINEYLRPVPTADSDPKPLGAIGKLALFSAFTPATGRELWRTDGTSQGTQLVKDLWQGMESGIDAVTQAMVLEDQLLFWSHHPQEIWLMRTNGMAQGTQLIARFPFNVASVNNMTDPSFIRFAKQLYFWVDDGQHGLELWRSNGKTAELVLDATQEKVKSYIYAPPVLQTSHALYFVSPTEINHSYDNHSNRLLWQVTETSATPVYEFKSKSNEYISLLAADKQRLVFIRQPDFQTANELWVLNVLTQQAQPLKTLESSANGYPIGQAAWFNGQLHWWMESLDANGSTEWWRSDLTSEGTYRLLSEPYPNAEYKTPPECFNFAQHFYCFTKDGTRPVQVWQSDGTLKGTRKLLQANAGFYAGDTGQGWSDIPSSYIRLGDRLVFVTFSPKGREYSQLWSLSAQQPDKLLLLGEFDDPVLLRPAADTPVKTLQFISKQQRWQTDGSVVGTKVSDTASKQVQTPTTLTTLPSEQQLLAFQLPETKWLFVNQDTKAGIEPWLLTANPALSVLLKDINQVPADSKVREVRAVGQAWYFIMDFSQLWFKPQVNAPAQKVVGIPAGEMLDYNAHPVVVAEDALYFITKQAQRYSVWYAEAGIAHRLSTYEDGFVWLFPAQKGLYVTHNLTQGYRIQHWQNRQVSAEIREMGSDSKNFMSLCDTPQGLIFVLKPPYNPEKPSMGDELWWQASPKSVPQLLTSQFLSGNFPAEALQQTAEQVYVLQEQPLNQNYEQTYVLSRLDFAQKRLVPVTSLPVLLSQTRIKAVRHGLYILTGEQTQGLWYWADGQSQPFLLKQFTAEQNVNLAQVQGNTLYLNVRYRNREDLWMSQATVTSTRLVKTNLAMEQQF